MTFNQNHDSLTQLGGKHKYTSNMRGVGWYNAISNIELLFFFRISYEFTRSVVNISLINVVFLFNQNRKSLFDTEINELETRNCLFIDYQQNGFWGIYKSKSDFIFALLY